MLYVAWVECGQCGPMLISDGHFAISVSAKSQLEAASRFYSSQLHKSFYILRRFNSQYFSWILYKIRSLNLITQKWNIWFSCQASVSSHLQNKIIQALMKYFRKTIPNNLTLSMGFLNDQFSLWVWELMTERWVFVRFWQEEH